MPVGDWNLCELQLIILNMTVEKERHFYIFYMI